MERSLILSPSNHSGNCGRVSRDNSRIKFDRHFLVTGSWSARARVGAPLVKGDVNIYAVLQRNHAIYHSLKLLSEVIKALASATPRRVKLTSRLRVLHSPLRRQLAPQIIQRVRHILRDVASIVHLLD